MLHQGVSAVGRPEALYHDRHGIFVRPPRNGSASIVAHSPQAKGRIERLFGTLQDRLVAELRLAGATTLGKANRVLTAYLPGFTARFDVPATSAEAAWRPLPAQTDPWQSCCVRYLRTVGRDDMVRLGNHRRQLLPARGQGPYARSHVEVRAHIDGSLSGWQQCQRIATQAAPAEAPVLRARHGESVRQRRSRRAGRVGPGVFNAWCELRRKVSER